MSYCVTMIVRKKSSLKAGWTYTNNKNQYLSTCWKILFIQTEAVMGRI